MELAEHRLLHGAGAGGGAKKRFLYVIHYPVFGGPHNRGAELALPLADAGWETVALLPDEHGNGAARLAERGIEVVTMPLGRIRVTLDPRPHLRLIRCFAGEVRALRRVIRERRIELVVIPGLPNPHAAIAARLEGVPVVWQITDSRLPRPARKLMRSVLRRLATVVMTTGETIGREHGIAATMPERWVPFFSPVDLDKFAADPARRAAARAALGLGEGDVVIGTVGNLNPQKGHGTFVRAAAELRRSLPDARFVVLGSGHDTHRRYVEELREEARSLGLDNGSLLIRDPGAEVDDLAQALDVFWLTSEPRSEGVPTVIMEAMALSLPVVATDVGGVRDIVEDGQNGLLVPARSPGEQAAATVSLLGDRRRLDEMGRRARSSAEQRFRMELSVAVHLEAFALAERLGRGGLRRTPA